MLYSLNPQTIVLLNLINRNYIIHCIILDYICQDFYFYLFRLIFIKKCLTLHHILDIISLFAGMAELADALDLGSSGRPCRFKSCCPYYLQGFQRFLLLLKFLFFYHFSLISTKNSTIFFNIFFYYFFLVNRTKRNIFL